MIFDLHIVLFKVPVMEIFLHTIEDMLIRREKKYKAQTKQSVEDQILKGITINQNIVRVEPIEDRQRKLRKWSLDYIEFMGNVVIIACIGLFTCVYVIIGVFLYFNH